MSYLGMKKMYITNRLGSDYVEGPGDELLFHCPFCEELGKKHSDRKLYVNSVSGWYWCHRCESRGRFSFGANMKDFRSIDIVEDIYEYFSGEESPEEFIYKDIPKDRVVDLKGSGAYNYMKSRGFTDKMMDEADLRVDTSLSAGQLFGRVVIPNQVVSRIFTDMYVARSFVGDLPKYLYPSDSNKSKVVYNIDNIPKGVDAILINEGALDSIVAGLDKSVAIYGKHCSNDQLNQILKKDAKNYYVSLDADAKEESSNLCQRIYERCSLESRVYLVELPENQDAVDLGTEKYLEVVMNSKEYIPKRFRSLYEYFD